MQRFTRLYSQLDDGLDAVEAQAALVEYLKTAPASDGAWAIHLLAGGSIVKCPTKSLKQAAIAAAGIPTWLAELSQNIASDVAELCALLAPMGEPSEISLAELVEQYVLPLRTDDAQEKRQRLGSAWAMLDVPSRIIFNRIASGSLRQVVSRADLASAIAQAAQVSLPAVDTYLSEARPKHENWTTRLRALESHCASCAAYPFMNPVASASLDDPRLSDWMIERQIDGWRVQLIRRGGRTRLCSCRAELSHAFGNIIALGQRLRDDTVIDGVLVSLDNGAIGPSANLALALEHRDEPPSLFHEDRAALVAFDLLQLDGVDLRALPLFERRAALELLHGKMQSPIFQISDLVTRPTGDGPPAGLIYKRRDSAYAPGEGHWRLIEPARHRIKAVLLSAAPGKGSQASFFSDYSVGVWQSNTLVPISKPINALGAAAIEKIDRHVRRHTLERFGPVRSIAPAIVLEIEFSAVELTQRTRSGLSLLNPRALSWMVGDGPESAHTLDQLRVLVKPEMARA